jgi:hypothetical protein
VNRSTRPMNESHVFTRGRNRLPSRVVVIENDFVVDYAVLMIPSRRR